MNRELKENEVHPIAYQALAYVKRLGITKLSLYMEAMCSVNIEHRNRETELCIGTLERVLQDRPVGERYILGLAWFLRDLEEKNETISN